jgi:hypothetical protein
MLAGSPEENTNSADRSLEDKIPERSNKFMFIFGQK